MRVYDKSVETISRDRLEKLRWARLKEALEHAYETSPYYRHQFRIRGVRPEQVTDAKAFSELVPTFDKSDFMSDQSDRPPYGSRLAVNISEIAATFLTSGSTGAGQEVHAFSRHDFYSTLSSWMRSLHWSGVQKGGRAYLMMPIGVTAGPVSLYRAFQSYGLDTLVVGGMDGAARLEMMQRFPPTYFACSPIYLRRFSKICEDHNIEPARDFSRLQAIKLGTGAYPTDWLNDMTEFWGTTIVDSYASTQAASGLALSCEEPLVRGTGDRGMLHFLEDKIYVEVVDPDTGEPVDPGEAGELIVTPFHREASPVIRFRTGDRAIRRLSSDCPCGRPFDGVEAGTIGRYDGMLKIRGMNLWPEAVDEIVLAHPGVQEYNGRVTIDEIGREVAEVLVLFDDSVQPKERSAALVSIESAVRAKTSVGVLATEASPGDVRPITYKEPRWIDDRQRAMSEADL